MQAYRDTKMGEPWADRKLRQKWESTIGWDDPANDAISARLERVVERIEGLCRPAIEEVERHP